MMRSTWQPGVEVRDLRSEVLGQELQLFVKLPWTYERAEVAYPVLYCLDANRSFPLYSTMSLIFETPAMDAREMMVVGLGYKLDDDRMRGLAQWGAWRTRDLTPVRREEAEKYWRELLAKVPDGGGIEIQTGGAPLFLRLLREEVIPWIEAHYRATPVDRGLAGYSYGGLFVLYALFHAPELFTRYFAGSPSMWEVLFEYEEGYAAAHKDLEARLLMTAGSREAALLGLMERMAERLRGRGYPSLKITTHVFEGEGHSSAYAAAVSRALQELYYGAHP